MLAVCADIRQLGWLLVGAMSMMVESDQDEHHPYEELLREHLAQLLNPKTAKYPIEFVQIIAAMLEPHPKPLAFFRTALSNLLYLPRF